MGTPELTPNPPVMSQKLHIKVPIDIKRTISKDAKGVIENYFNLKEDLCVLAKEHMKADCPLKGSHTIDAEVDIPYIPFIPILMTNHPSVSVRLLAKVGEEVVFCRDVTVEFASAPAEAEKPAEASAEKKKAVASSWW